MRSRLRSAAAGAALTGAVLVALLNGAGPATAQVPAGATVMRPVLTAQEWRTYSARYVDPSGRVMDVEKNGVSHSEGQGYGMLLAVYADDEATFRSILRFTFGSMRRRGDGLISWIYDPERSPQITDTNNASDGDILVAFALVQAAMRWNEPSYRAAAEPLIAAIGEHLLYRSDGMVVLRPAAFGFGPRQHEDGPVVNLSYFVYGAFLLFAEIDDRYPWLEAWQSGLRLTMAALAGREALVPDWVTLRRERYLEPARGFARKSSYDAVRIPLYMMLAGRVPPEYIAPFDDAWNRRGNGAPLDWDLGADRKVSDMNDPGYRAIAALAGCAVRGEPMPRSLRRFRPTTYFASSLHLLTLAAARRYYPQCVEDAAVPMVVADARPVLAPAAMRPARTARSEARRPAARRARRAGDHFDMGRAVR